MSLSAHRLRLPAGTDPPFFDGVKNTEVPGMRKAGQSEFKHLSIFYFMACEMHGQERFGREDSEYRLSCSQMRNRLVSHGFFCYSK